MKELTAKAAAILQAAQRNETPSADVRVRVWEQTRLRAAAGDLGPALPEAVVTTSVATSKLLAWVAAAAMGGGAVVGGILLAREPAPSTSPAPSEVEVEVEVEVEPVVREVEEPIGPAPVLTVEPVEPLEEPAEATVAEVTVPRRRAPARAATKSTQGEEQDAGSGFGEEVELLARARAALGRGEASKALSLLEQHAKQFPRGALGPERDVSRIMALCALGRVEQARDHATAFMRRHPRSALAERVRRTCAGDP